MRGREEVEGMERTEALGGPMLRMAAASGQSGVIRTREIKDLTVGLATKIGGQTLVNRYADR